MASAAAEEASLTVRVEAGAVRGRVAEAASLDCARRLRYRSFQGIPYARPPVGELRFKPPEPVQPWEGVRDACSEGAECAQLDFWERHYKGDEDCLYLNVYTPLVESAAGAGRWPTMVWVHGGGFAHSSGTAREYGPDYLLAHDVVLVTFNYRLGPLEKNCRQRWKNIRIAYVRSLKPPKSGASQNSKLLEEDERQKGESSVSAGSSPHMSNTASTFGLNQNNTLPQKSGTNWFNL